MAKIRRRLVILVAPLALAAMIYSLAWFGAERGTSASDSLPPVFLWAWERPEDLRFLKGLNAGVAVLAGTVTLEGDRAAMRPRLQPLRLADGTPVAAVVRIESDQRGRPALSRRQAQETVDAILNLGGNPRAAIIQVDFDALFSERGFYRLVLADLRRRMPSGKTLSMTALASWCSGDPWIRELPVDEFVPMLFQMGPDEPHIRRQLARTGRFRLEACRDAVGLSVDEPWVTQLAARRRYIFSSAPWTEEQGLRAVREALAQP